MLAPKWILPEYAIGCFYSNRENFAEALPHFRRAIDLDSTYPDAYHLAGAALIAQKKYSEAMPMIKKAIELQPDDAYVYGSEAEIYFWGYNDTTRASKSLGKCILQLKEDVRINPKFSATFFYNIACIYARLCSYDIKFCATDQFNSAFEYLEKALNSGFMDLEIIHSPYAR